MLLTDNYKDQQRQLHESNNFYGTSSGIYKNEICALINATNPAAVLDYGCGKGGSASFIKKPLTLYDPCIPGRDAKPLPADMVICTDVLEHIEPEFLDSILDDLQRLTKSIGFFSIHTGPAKKVLIDGRNAHLIQEEFRWWLPKLWERFEIMAYNRAGGGFYVIVVPRGKKWL